MLLSGDENMDVGPNKITDDHGKDKPHWCHLRQFLEGSDGGKTLRVGGKGVEIKRDMKQDLIRHAKEGEQQWNSTISRGIKKVGSRSRTSQQRRRREGRNSKLFFLGPECILQLLQSLEPVPASPAPLASR